MKKPELLSPVGDLECLKAAVQNGADAVYMGASLFNARNSATNFSNDDLKEAIKYAKLRNVKVNLTLNILIKNDEFEEAFNLAKLAYEYGVDAIIVQDLGLAKTLISSFPDLAIHASTQMTAHNLESVLKLQEMGFKRVVLSRELPIEEIKYIKENCNVELEVFIHGALCISYSGQCLFSSMVGGRSGNRGKCAQPCRLPYELYENNYSIDKGYILSPKDLCSLENLKELMDAGIDCFKIEGRMKTPEYVATVTKIYRKNIDQISENNLKAKNLLSDKTDLLQVFNRGGFSTGHQNVEPNTSLVYKEKANNMGIYLGEIYDFNPSKGYVKLTLEAPLSIGDTISINNSRYNVSELMINNNNVKTANISDKVTIGRAKGEIKKSNKVYKIESKTLFTLAQESISKENKKIYLEGNIFIKENMPITFKVNCTDTNGFYSNLSNTIITDIIPQKAISSPITKERILGQLIKTGNTEFEFSNIKIELDENLYIPSISVLNELRRNMLSGLEEIVIKNNTHLSNKECPKISLNKFTNNNKIVSVLLNKLNPMLDYTSLNNIQNVYIPFKLFIDKNYKNTIINISNKFNTYIYLPTISRKNYLNLISTNLDNVFSDFKISGFVVSNLGELDIVKKYNLPIIANYTFNLFNTYTIKELKDLGFTTYTISPELDKVSFLDLSIYENTELIAYGNLPLMNLNYCLLGKSNKCYKDCKRLCITNSNYFIKDRLGLDFKVVPDNTRCITTIYNSKTLSIDTSSLNISNYRIDILDESIDEIKEAINSIIEGKKLEGKDYTNGNLNRII